MGKVKNTLALVGSGYIVYQVVQNYPTIANYVSKVLPYAQKAVEKGVEEIPKMLAGD